MLSISWTVMKKIWVSAWGKNGDRVKCCTDDCLESTAWALAVPIPFTASPGSQACWLCSTRDLVSVVCWASLSFVTALFRWGRFW
jgi:hypothetical protein